MALGLAAAFLPAATYAAKIMLPVRSALESPVGATLASSNFQVSFGSALPDGLSVVNENLMARGKADRGGTPMTMQGQGRPMTDQESCVRAFIDALGALARKAREAGGSAMVGVVSTHEGVDFDSKDRVECHTGFLSAVVELKGKAAVPGPKLAPPVATAAATAPAPATLPLAPAVPAAPPVPLRHRATMPPATNFARGSDVNAVPLSDAGKARYRHYLTLPSPKVFVIFDTGAWRFYFEDPEAMTKALDYCANERKTCWLYAVDDRVVWSDNVAKRIGKSGQLGNE